MYKTGEVRITTYGIPSIQNNYWNNSEGEFVKKNQNIMLFKLIDELKKSK